MTEMMRYYNPRWLAWCGFASCIVHSITMPMFGFIMSKYVFIFALPLDTQAEIDAFRHERNVWSWAFVGLVIGFGLASFF